MRRGVEKTDFRLRDLPHCWVPKRILRTICEERGDLAGLATIDCKYRRDNNQLISPTFYCKHPKAIDGGKETKVTEFCEPYKLRSKK